MAPRLRTFAAMRSSVRVATTGIPRVRAVSLAEYGWPGAIRRTPRLVVTPEWLVADSRRVSAQGAAPRSAGAVDQRDRGSDQAESAGVDDHVGAGDVEVAEREAQRPPHGSETGGLGVGEQPW